MDKHIHQKLKISFAELGALYGVRELIKSGALVHDASACVAKPGVHAITMDIPCNANECGSVGCIGGTMGLLMGMSEDEAKGYVYRAEDDSTPFKELFFPTIGTGYANITGEQIIMAIDNFLVDGKPRWQSVLAPRKRKPAKKAPVKKVRKAKTKARKKR